MENILNLFTNLLNKNGQTNQDLSSNLSTLLPLFSSLMENNKKSATEVAPETLSQKLNVLIRTMQ